MDVSGSLLSGQAKAKGREECRWKDLVMLFGSISTD